MEPFYLIGTGLERTGHRLGEWLETRLHCPGLVTEECPGPLIEAEDTLGIRGQLQQRNQE